LYDGEDAVIAKEYEITAWRQPPGSATDLRLRFPAAVAALPGVPAPLLASPPPGRYWLSVGSDAPTLRSNTVPISVAAFIAHAVVPAMPPHTTPRQLDPGPGGIYTVDGRGFSAGSTKIFVGDAELTPGGTGDGQFEIISDAQLQFKPPAALPQGNHLLRVRVNGIESPPSWSIEK
jgi:hypothetical protein